MPLTESTPTRISGLPSEGNAVGRALECLVPDAPGHQPVSGSRKVRRTPGESPGSIPMNCGGGADLPRPETDRYQPAPAGTRSSTRGRALRRHLGGAQARPAGPLGARRTRHRRLARGLRGEAVTRGTSYDPSDPMGKMFFNILATFGGVKERIPGGPRSGEALQELGSEVLEHL